MTKKQEAHLKRIKKQFLKDVDLKYRTGQIEHGGNMWLKPKMLENAMDEVIDLYVYLVTLKEQLSKKK